MTATASPALPHACAPELPGVGSGAPPAEAAPRRSAGRLVGIDAARGVALIGMMAVHTIDPVDEQGDPTLAWTLAAGRSAALFAVLAGVGIALASGGRRRPGLRTWPAYGAALLVRAVLIGAIGLLLGELVPDDLAAVILPYYALLFVLAVPLLGLSPRGLVELAVVIGVAVPVLSHFLRAGTEPVAPVPNLTFQDLVDTPSVVLRELTLTGAYPALAWMAYLCVGMAVGRADLSSRGTVVRMVMVGAALLVGARAVSGFLLDVLGGRAELEAVTSRTRSVDDLTEVLAIGWTGTTPTDTGWWLATMAPHSTTPLDLASTIGLSLVVLGLAILVGRATTFWLRPLAAAGSMTLTLYSLHLVLLSWHLMPGDADGLLLHVAVVVAFALLWSRYHRRGPVEEIVALLAEAVRNRLLPDRRARRAARSAVPEPAERVEPVEPAEPAGPAGDAAAAPAADPPAAAAPVAVAPAAVAPAAPSRTRLLGIDAARGLALLLIMGAHLLPIVADDLAPTPAYLLGGYGAVAFVLLAGVGVALATGGAARASGARLAEHVVVLVVRAVTIGAVGLALGYVVSAQEDATVVLVSFGAMFLLAIPFLWLGARGLGIAAVAIAVVVPVLVQLSWDVLPSAANVNHTFGDVVRAPGAWLAEVAATGVYPALPWMAYFCAGMAVGRLRSLTSERTAVLLVVGGVVLAAAGRIASWLLLERMGGLTALQQSGAENLAERVVWGPGGTLPRPSWWWLAVEAPYAATPLDLVHSCGVVLAGVGLVLLIARTVGRLLVPLAAAGRMTLSLYTAHLLALSLVVLPWGPVEGWLAHTALVLVIAPVWLAVFRRGPLEWLVAVLAAGVRRAVLPPPAGGPPAARGRESEGPGAAHLPAVPTSPSGV